MNDPWSKFAEAARPDQMLLNAYQLATASAGLAISAWDQVTRQGLDADPIPPMWLRYRGQGTGMTESFIELGKQSEASITGTLLDAGFSLTDFDQVLDFGCGCGRTLRWLRKLYPSVRFSGSDIDAEAIDWCQRHYPDARFRVNATLPPLDFADNQFDFIYALSVFTHLREDEQFAWLSELRRVLKPNGILLLSFLGYRPDKIDHSIDRDAMPVTLRLLTAGLAMNPWMALDPKEIASLARDGFFYTPGPHLGNTYHTQAYIRDQYTRHGLELLAYEEEGLAGFQDVALFRKG